jgi:hypothetical protein
MPIMIPLGGVIEVVAQLFSTPRNQVGEMTCGQVCDSVTGTGVTALDYANMLGPTFFGAGLNAAWSANSVRRKLTVYLLSPGTGKAVDIGQVIGSAPGTLAEDDVSAQVAAVVRKNSTVPGRAFRGRVFWPFHTKGAFTSAGELTAGAGTVILNTVITLFGSGTITGATGTGHFHPCLIHRKPLPLTQTEVVSFSITGLVGTQRRRGDYGRHNA